jgi:antitoxin component of RelBE/YafQ-DinJ toxin-antitoxin module
MTEMATVSAKIEKSKKEEMEQLGISPSDVIKKAVDDAIREKKRAKLIDEMNEAGKLIRNIPKESWVQAIRESRDER